VHDLDDLGQGHADGWRDGSGVGLVVQHFDNQLDVASLEYLVVLLLLAQLNARLGSSSSQVLSGLVEIEKYIMYKVYTMNREYTMYKL